MLASANPANPFAHNLSFPLLALGALAIIALLAFFPLRAARVRRHSRASLVTALTLLWALFAGGVFVFDAISETRWNSEQSIRLGSGYLDPTAPQPDAPPSPVPLFLMVALAYPPILAYAMSQRRRPPYE